MNFRYSDRHREGDHICYYSDLSRIRADYPEWNITKDLRTCFEEIADGWLSRLAVAD